MWQFCVNNENEIGSYEKEICIDINTSIFWPIFLEQFQYMIKNIVVLMPTYAVLFLCIQPSVKMTIVRIVTAPSTA